ncbi:hypothetical protein DPMN_157319 [Dreissena polymorpha]|uniref:Uncharacterized protein n=1 Tax=Dreissena polymorpha TaxID=45954 RepID=A0A9D4EJ48_DREPO|nr:hypothetical protein DPMN_157319 [Dreissena polymorpha]
MRVIRPNASGYLMCADNKDGRCGTSLSRLAVGALPGSHSGRASEYMYLASLAWQCDGR